MRRILLVMMLVIIASVATAEKVGPVHYVSNNYPEIQVIFKEPVQITNVEFYDGTGPKDFALESSEGNRVFNYKVSDYLEEGDYNFSIEAFDMRGNPMTGPKLVNITVDITSPLLMESSIKEGDYYQITTIPVEFNFSEPALLSSVYVNELNITGDLSSYEGGIRHYGETDIPDGTKELKLSARDYAGNVVEARISFAVNAYPTQIFLVYPALGVAQSTSFTLRVGTDEYATCGWDIVTPEGAVPTSPVGLEHSWGISGFTEGQVNPLFITCKDIYNETVSAEFSISIDTSPPLITAKVIPEQIAMYPLLTTLYVGSDDKVVCKVSETETEYDKMETFIDGGVEDDKDTYKTSLEQTIDNLADLTDYTYHVACRNMAGSTSLHKTVRFGVDTGTEGMITINGIEDGVYTSNTSFRLNVSTNVNAICYYGEGTPTNLMGTNEYTQEHVTSPFTLDDGTHTFVINCTMLHKNATGAYTTTVQETLTIIVDTSRPSDPIVTDISPLDNEYTYYTDRLEAKWKSTDNESGIKNYEYSIWQENKFKSDELIKNWTSTTSESKKITNLDLNDTKTYYFKVKSVNRAGLWSLEEGRSDGLTVDIEKIPPTCTNDKKDQNESDVDCGGPCDGCGVDDTCFVHADCLSGNCVAGKCSQALATCTDNVKNGDETDVDCGGSCDKCSESSECEEDSDCTSGYCSNGECKSTCLNGKFDPNEGDVDCGAFCPIKCGEGQSCASNSDCSSGNCDNFMCGKSTITPINQTPGLPGDLDGDGVNDTLDNCPNNANPTQTDDDGDGIGNECDSDKDGDGIPDEWENRWGLDPIIDDSHLDPDNDGLSNLDEYRVKDRWGESTDPNEEDTDGDTFSDKYELDNGTDPTDPNSFPSDVKKSSFFLLLLFILLLVIVLGGGYYYYENYYKKTDKKTPPPMQMTKSAPQRPTRPKTKTMQRQNVVQEKQQDSKLAAIKSRIEAEKDRKNELRKKVFDSFTDKDKASYIRMSKGLSEQELKDVRKVSKLKHVTDSKIKRLKGKPLAALKASKDKVENAIYKTIKDSRVKVFKANTNKDPDEDIFNKLISIKPVKAQSEEEDDFVKRLSSTTFTPEPEKKKESYDDYVKKLTDIGETDKKKSESDVMKDIEKLTKKKKKKGQIQSQIFIYILAVIVATAIFIYGYSAISSFKQQADDVGLLKFKSDLESAVKIISTDYESTRIFNEKHPLYVPQRYSEVCFTEPMAIVDAGEYPLIDDSVQDNAKANVYLVDKILEESFHVGDIDVENTNNFFCTPVVNGIIYLKLEGLGDKAKIVDIR